MQQQAYLRWLYSDASFLFIFSSIGEPGFSCFCTSYNSSLADQWIGQGGLAMINVGNNRHVSYILFFIHDLTDLFNCELHLEKKFNVSSNARLCQGYKATSHEKIVHFYLQIFHQLSTTLTPLPLLKWSHQDFFLTILHFNTFTKTINITNSTPFPKLLI